MPIDPMMSLRVQQYEVPDVNAARMRRASALRQEEELAQIAQQRQKRQQLDDTLRRVGPDLTPEGIAKIYQADPATGLELKRQYDQNQNVLADNARADAENAAKAQAAQAAATEKARTEQYKAVVDREKATEEEFKRKKAEELAKHRRVGATLMRVPAEDPAARRVALEALFNAGDIDQEDAQALLQAPPNEYQAHLQQIIATGLDEKAFDKVYEQYTAKPKEESKPAIVQEYEYAAKQGYKGSFDDYQNMDANRRRSITNINTGGAPASGGGDTKLTGDEFIKTLNPALAAQVKAIAAGFDVMPPASSRAPRAQEIRNAVYAFDPTFTTQRAQIRKAFTTGPDGKNIGALNTAIVHLDRLGGAAEAMRNGSFTPGNQAYNWLRDKFGSDKVTNFALLKNAVAGEMATAMKGAATDQEIAHMGETFRSAASPEQMAGAVSEGMAILADKANTYDERYHQQLPDDPWSPVLPQARAAMARRGGRPGSSGAAPKTQKWGRDKDGNPVPLK